MFAHNFIFISIGVVISRILCISNANGVTNEFHHQCAEYNFECDPLSPRPCCDPVLFCKLQKSRVEFVCGEKVKLDAPCITDEDCFEIMHAKCSAEKKCICRAKNLKLNETYCAPLLGGFCWKDEPCVTINTLCINNECQCKANYSASEDKCLPVLIDVRCSYDRDCANIKFAKCSKDNYCVCSLNTIVLNNSSCKSVLDSYCTTDSDCLVNNSVCKNTRCQCSSEYLAVNRNQCIRPYLGMSCPDDDFCDSYINHTICSPKNKCVCSPNSYYYNKNIHSLLFDISFLNYEECRTEQAFCFHNKCYHRSLADYSDKFCSENINCFGSLLEELCEIDKHCVPYNSVCLDGICKCANNYRNNSIFSCLPSMLNQNCWIDSHCSAIRNAECSDYQCTCKAGYIQSNATTCSPLLFTQCTEHDKCAVQHSICSNEQCECSDFFTPKSNDRCRSTLLHQTCETNSDCENIKFSYCSFYKLCSCRRNTFALNGSTCVALFDQYCSRDLPCATENSECVNDKCACKTLFKNFNAKCLPTRLGESCDSNRDCNMIKYAVCSASEKCSCLKNYISVNNALCSALIYERCQADNECYAGNSECVANKCQCKNDFVAVDFNSRCESTTLGKRCNTSEDCSMIKNSICSIDKICICPSKYFAVDSYVCTPTINATCFNDIQCSNNLFRCLDGKCQCKSGYTAISVDKCMETSLMYSCRDISECSDSWHWNCATSGKCVCHENNIAINDSICLPLLNGFCWRDDQCLAKNSVCSDFRCHCKREFVAVANNHCVFYGKMIF